MGVGLCLGAPLCRPHKCHHCGAEVDCLATHGLSCRWSEGSRHRHAAINDIVHRSLTSAKIPAHLEPSGLYRSDGKRPDGILWSPGKMESCWCGTRHALTPFHRHTLQGPPMRQGLWLLKRKRGRKPNIHTSTPRMPSPQWPLRLRVSLGQK